MLSPLGRRVAELLSPPFLHLISGVTHTRNVASSAQLCSSLPAKDAARTLLTDPSSRLFVPGSCIIPLSLHCLFFWLLVLVHGRLTLLPFAFQTLCAGPRCVHELRTPLWGQRTSNRSVIEPAHRSPPYPLCSAPPPNGALRPEPHTLFAPAQNRIATVRPSANPSAFTPAAIVGPGTPDVAVRERHPGLSLWGTNAPQLRLRCNYRHRPVYRHHPV